MADGAMSVEDVRRRNLGAILRLIHERGPQSRARLTAATGLNRSTVGDLVAALAAAGVVTERDPDPTKRVGRPSPVVAAHEDLVAVTVNPEVDAIEAAVVGLNGVVRARVRDDVDHLLSPEEVAQRVGGMVAQWGSGDYSDARIVGIGIAVPGLVRALDGVVRFAPHLGWRDTALAALVQQETGLPVHVGNDASLGARAEHLFGAAQGHADVVYLNGGASGIGGGIILDGRLVSGVGGFAGEWGQNRAVIESADDRRSARGILEDEVSRSRLLDAIGLSVADDNTLAAAMASSADSVLNDEIARQRRILAVSLASAVNVLNPSLIVLGGFLRMIFDADADDFAGAVRARAMEAPADDVLISAAALGDDRLLIGAAELAFASLLANPLA